MFEKEKLKYIHNLFRTDVEEYGTISHAALAFHCDSFYLCDGRGISDTHATTLVNVTEETYRSVSYERGERNDEWGIAQFGPAKCSFYSNLYGPNSNFHECTTVDDVLETTAMLHLQEIVTGPVGDVVIIERADTIEELE